MDSATLANVLITTIGVPVMTLLTLWVRSALSSGEKRQKRNDDTEDSYRGELLGRVSTLEREVKELRVELKNRDKEYVALFQEHATLRAKHEILQAEYDQTVKELHSTQAELTALKEDIKRKSATADIDVQKL